MSKMRLSMWELRTQNQARFLEHLAGEDEWTLGQWAFALCGEVGEAFNAQKKLWRGDGSVEHLGSELADVLIYADLIAAKVAIECHLWARVWGEWIHDRNFPYERDLASELKNFRELHNAAGFLLDSCIREVDARYVVMRLNSLAYTLHYVAWRSRVDFASAVIRTFNAKSEKWNSACRLVGVPLPEGCEA